MVEEVEKEKPFGEVQVLFVEFFLLNFTYIQKAVNLLATFGQDIPLE